MAVVIEKISADRLVEYASVPMLCEVRSEMVVEKIPAGLGALGFTERPVNRPYTKNYDTYADGGPLNWPGRFDLSNWGFWLALDAGETVGGAAVAWNTPSVEMLDGRRDLAVLWDLRVRSSHQRRGVGSALFQAASHWTKTKGCSHLKIETQNVNVAACRFYASMGCELVRIDPQRYRHCAEIADEAMLIWNLDLNR